jgi:hypothetical protein
MGCSGTFVLYTWTMLSYMAKTLTKWFGICL